MKKRMVKLPLNDHNGIAFERCKSTVILEDFPITVTGETQVLDFIDTFTSPHFDTATLKNRLIIVSDDVFKTLVTTATQIIARNVLNDDTKKSENLWYEEVVPADALFYTIMKPTFKGNESITNLEKGINGQILQIGGNETIGYGLVKMSGNLTESLALKQGGIKNG
ncbi:MAG: type III-B CRISPR module RAMP protein Cmr4 [Candidatus Desantisbacteria bacterium]